MSALGGACKVLTRLQRTWHGCAVGCRPPRRKARAGEVRRAQAHAQLTNAAAAGMGKRGGPAKKAKGEEAAAPDMAMEAAPAGVAPAVPDAETTSSDYYFDSYSHFGACIAAAGRQVNHLCARCSSSSQTPHACRAPAHQRRFCQPEPRAARAGAPALARHAAVPPLAQLT